MINPPGSIIWRAVRSSVQPAKCCFLHILGRRLSAAQHAADTRQQLAWLERLGQIIVRPHFKTEDPVDRLAARGQHDDRNVRRGAQLAAKSQAVFARHVQIQHEQIDAFAVQHFCHRDAVLRG
jgi:hypothetical protein